MRGQRQNGRNGPNETKLTKRAISLSVKRLKQLTNNNKQGIIKAICVAVRSGRERGGVGVRKREREAVIQVE